MLVVALVTVARLLVRAAALLIEVAAYIADDESTREQLWDVAALLIPVVEGEA